MQAPRRNYYLAHAWPAEGVLPDDAWRMPEWAASAIDLRGNNAGGYMLCSAPPRAQVGDAILIGRGLEAPMRPAARRNIAKALGVSSLDADNVADLIAEIFTEATNPEGDGIAPTPMPAGQSVEVYLDDQLVYTRSLKRMTRRYRAQMVELYKRDIAKICDECGEAVAGKVLNRSARRLRMQSDDLLPKRLRGLRRRKDETTYTDDFNRADSSNLGANWSEVAGNAEIMSNQLRFSAGSLMSVRYQQDLSSSDNQGQIDHVIHNAASVSVVGGPDCRYSSSADTSYEMLALDPNPGSNVLRFRYRIAGVATTMGADVSWSKSIPATLAVRAVGSTITGYLDGVLVGTRTDSNISSGTRCGITGFYNFTGSSELEFDDFEATDEFGNRRRRFLCGAA